MNLKNIFNKNIICNKPTSLLLTTDNIDFDTSQSCLEYFILLEEKYFNINKNHLQSAHIGIKDNNIEILQEGFGDFINSVISFFKNLLDKFKEFMKRIFMVIYAYLGDFEKFLDKYKEELRGLDPKFSIKGFKYTFKSNIPNLEIIDNIINSYNSELNDIDNMTRDKIIEQREKFMSTTNLNKIRANIIGVTGEVSSEDYLKDVKKIFRDNNDEKIDIDVNKSFLTTIIADYPFLKKEYSDSIKERDNIIVIIEKIKSFFEKSASVYYKGTDKTIGVKLLNRNGNKIQINDTVEKNHSESKINLINTFFSFKFTQSKEIGSICTIACIEKANALKECLSFYRETIKRCAFKGPKKSTEDD